MKKVSMFMMVIAMMVFSANNVLSAEKEDSWKLAGEGSTSVHNGYVDGASGAQVYGKTVFKQTAKAGMEKGREGVDKKSFYIKAEYFAPYVSEEPRIINFYGGLNFIVDGATIDVGYAHYWDSYVNSIDYNVGYLSVDFPDQFWKIIPFINLEARFARSYRGNSDGSKTSMDGFLWYSGLKREFEIIPRLSLSMKISIGGNTGIYGILAETLSFSREEAQIVYHTPIKWLDINASVMAQQNLGLRDGIAADTDNKIYVSGGLAGKFK